MTGVCQGSCGGATVSLCGTLRLAMIIYHTFMIVFHMLVISTAAEAVTLTTASTVAVPVVIVAVVRVLLVAPE
jgi:hypothetical protein